MDGRLISSSRSGNSAGMRVAVLTASVSQEAGGLFTAMTGLCSGMAASDCDVRVFGGLNGHAAEEEAQWGRSSLVTQEILGPRTFGFQRELMGRVREFDPDLLHVHGLWTYPSVVCTQWSKAGGPYLISPHGMLDSWAIRNSRLKKRLAGLLYENSHLRGAACIHALCDSERDAIREYGLRNPICVIPNGVELPVGPSRMSPAAWVKEIPRDAKVLLYLGRIHPKKGLRELLKAWREAAQQKTTLKDWFLVIAGWDQGGHQRELEALAEVLEITARIRFIGPQFGDLKRATFERSQAFILPSFSEGLPMTVLEAWSHGLPVLMTPHCNLNIGFERGAAMPMRAIGEDIARALCELGEFDESERMAMGMRGKRLVADRFLWEFVSREMRFVYEWMLGRGDRPSSVSF